MPNLPLLVPVVVVGVLIAVFGGPALARRLHCPTWVAVVLVVSLTLVIGVTLTPQSLSGDLGERTWPFTWILVLLNERILNVLLFVPLGLTAALIGLRVRGIAVVAVLVLPWVVEGIQNSVGWLSRDSQWQDVVDNTLGAAIGIGIGLLVRRRMSLRSRESP